VTRGLLPLLALAGCLAAQELNPVKWSAAAEGPVKPGAVVRVKLTAVIEEGWHLYSLKKLEGGPIPTRITVPEGQAFSLAGEIEAPPPETVHDPVFDMEVEYYSERAEFVVPVKAAAGAAGRTVVKVSARYQTCTEKLCLPPRVAVAEAGVIIEP
jgi:thiol:disulfide interchange protein DsbD